MRSRLAQTSQWGGQNRKTNEQHRKAGTLRADRHGVEYWQGDPEGFRAQLRQAEHHKIVVDQYCQHVLDGTIPAGRLVRLAVERYLWDLEEGHKRGLTFDEGRATEACEFFPAVLCHSKGQWAGKPFQLTPCQTFIVWNIFGWMKENGLRRFTRAHNEVARKFGKSELASGAALKQGSFDDPADIGAEIYLCATKEDQAKTTTFRQCCRMVQRSEFLRLRIRAQVKALTVSSKDPFQADSTIRPIGSDSNSSDGFDASGAVLDEVHAYQRRHQGFYERMTSAGGSRQQELVTVWTTAGDDKSELWLEIREMAVRALESVESREPVNDHIFAFIACIDEDDDPLSLDEDSPEFERMMVKANPNMPVTPRLDYLKQQAREAKSSLIQRNKFLRFHCNRRVSSSVQPFPTELWTKYQKPIEKLPDLSMGGFDMGRSDDFSAWAVVWREDDVYRLVAKAYTCKERRDYLRTPQIQGWIDKGYLVEHPGSSVDFAAFQEDIIEVHNRYNVQKWAFDEHFAKLTGQWLQEKLGENVLLKFPQSHTYYNEPCRNLLKEFTDGNLAPDENPATAWQFRNITFASNTKDEWMPDKGIGREYKIDAGVAGLMAYGAWLFEQPDMRVGGVTFRKPSKESVEAVSDMWARIRGDN